MSMHQHFSWYDLETSGTSNSQDQIYQFAAIKTDRDLNIIPHTEVNIMCKPRPDVVPHPMAFLTHGIDINQLKMNGMTEFELAAFVHDYMLSSSGNIISGYNNMAFDDIFLRQLMYRNMQPPYEHEYKDGNSRFDAFKYIQMIYAFRPDILEWAKNEDGGVSMKLDAMAQANGIVHENAHDALSDVHATIGITKIVKERNPRSFDFFLNLMDKDLNRSIMSRKQPLLHVSGIFGRDVRNTSMILPVAIDKGNKNKFLCIDLRQDPTDMLAMSSAEIKKYLFTKRSELPEGHPIVPAIGVQTNNLPVIMDAKSTLSSGLADRLSLDLDACYQNMEKIQGNREFMTTLQNAFLNSKEPPKDAYEQLYSNGFINNNDARIRHTLTAVTGNNGNRDTFSIETESTHVAAMRMQDSIRHQELITRSKWGNFYQELIESENFSPAELYQWSKYLVSRLTSNEGHSGLTVDEYASELALVESEVCLTDAQVEMMRDVTAHVEELKAFAEALAEHARLEIRGETPDSAKSIQRFERMKDQVYDSMAIN